jgi:hypothetical protein
MKSVPFRVQANERLKRLHGSEDSVIDWTRMEITTVEEKE